LIHAPSEFFGRGFNLGKNSAVANIKLNFPFHQMNRARLKLRLSVILPPAKLRQIRLNGHWLEQARFNPNHQVEIHLMKACELMLQFKAQKPAN